jgi:hypothetical protein
MPEHKCRAATSVLDNRSGGVLEHEVIETEEVLKVWRNRIRWTVRNKGAKIVQDAETVESAFSAPLTNRTSDRVPDEIAVPPSDPPWIPEQGRRTAARGSDKTHDST